VTSCTRDGGLHYTCATRRAEAAGGLSCRACRVRSAIPCGGNDSGCPPLEVARAGGSNRSLRFLASLLDTSTTRFGTALRRLFEYRRRESRGRTVHRGHGACLTRSGATVGPDGGEMPDVYDALVCLQLLEHLMRPLAALPVRAKVSHCVANGLSCCRARRTVGARTPILLTDTASTCGNVTSATAPSPYRWPVKAVRWFLPPLRAPRTAKPARSPWQLYNQRWEERLGASTPSSAPSTNGVEPDQFPRSKRAGVPP